ncbi:MAG: right-handed parallel beta-helix repeat-containing protein [Candidatus Avoscillospira sp.]
MATYYIDFQNGCDANDGHSPDSPLRTQHPELLQPGDTVLFHRGGFFRGKLENPSGVPGKPIVFGAYGEGEPPVFCGSQDLSDPALWKQNGEKVWQFTGFLQGEAGNLIFSDGTCGTLRWTEAELKEQGDWFDSCFGYTNREVPLPADHRLLVCSRCNPGWLYRSIECATAQNTYLAYCGHDMVINGLTFQNNGHHGIAGEEGGKNIQITNCRFLRIGGLVWSAERRIRYGNAVEFWNRADRVLVENCLFEDIYDSAVTHQGGKDCEPAVDLVIRNNVFRKCGMAAYEQRDRLPISGAFSGNLCEDAGEGFSKLGVRMPRSSEIWPRPMGHHVFLWRISTVTGAEKFAICDNVFRDAPYGAAIYSMDEPDVDQAIRLSGNKYQMNRKCLLNRMFNVDFPDLKTWEERNQMQRLEDGNYETT